MTRAFKMHQWGRVSRDLQNKHGGEKGTRKGMQAGGWGRRGWEARPQARRRMTQERPQGLRQRA